jgi:uncharacterized protein (DUF488 family)
MAAARIYSVGYEGLTQQGFTERMSQSRVEVVVDVRLNAASRKAGFSKRGLSLALGEVGIEYVHEPKLGNPPENRESFRVGDGVEGSARMRELLANGSGDALRRVAALASERRIALLCYERDHARCHRAVIASALGELEPELELIQVL